MMDMVVEQSQLQFLGVHGIFKESFKLILSSPKLFTQITLSLILPLSFIFLAHFYFSQLIFFGILNNEASLHRTPYSTLTYDKLSDLLLSQWTSFFLFKFAYFTLFLTLSLFSTSAVVSTVASIYASEDVTFGKVMSVVPKVWNRLIVTFNWNLALILAYNVFYGFLFVFWIALIGPNYSLGFAIGVILLMLYLTGFVYIAIIWHLASVISVLESTYGKEAMIKSKELMKCKMGTGIVVSLLIFVCFLGNQLGFEIFVVIGLGGNGELRIGVAILCLIFLLIVILFGLIAQSLLYFVCKSYRHESIQKSSSFADHFGDCLGEYVPLKAKDLQLP